MLTLLILANLVSLMQDSSKVEELWDCDDGVWYLRGMEDNEIPMSFNPLSYSSTEEF